MKLVRVLDPAAPSGVAYFYEPDTTTQATKWSSENREDGDLITGPVSLSSSGYCQVYVDGEVDVKTYTAAGVVSQQYTVADGDASTLVRSASFTGTQANGTQGLGGKTDVRTVLDGWLPSAGASDFRVLREGQTVSQTIQGALASIENANAPFYNVKDYAATGDGFTDDTAFVQAAIDAAEAASGGIVFFPKGVYLCSQTLTVTSANVGLLGTGRGSEVRYSGTAGNGISINGASATCGSSVRDLFVHGSGPSSGKAITITACPGIRLDNVTTEGFETPLYLDCRATVTGGYFLQEFGGAAAAGKHGIHLTANADMSVVSGAKVEMGAVGGLNSSGIYTAADAVLIAHNIIDMTNSSGSILGGGVYIDTSVDGVAVIGNVFNIPATGIHYRIWAYTALRVLDVGNFNYPITGSTDHRAMHHSGGQAQSQKLSIEGTRDSKAVTATAGPSRTVNISSNHKIQYIDITGGGAGTGIIVSAAFTGQTSYQEIYIFVKNSLGVNQTVDYDATFDRNGTTDTIAAGNTLKLLCICDVVGLGATSWTVVSVQNP